MADPPKDLIWFEFEPDDPNRPNEIRVKVSTPKDHQRYIDRLVTAVGYGIYLGGYHVYCEGVDLPVFVPESMVDFSAGVVSERSNNIFDSAEEARALLAGSPAGKVSTTYFWGAGGAVVSPTVFSPATTPQIIATMLDVRKALADAVTTELTALAISLIGGAIFKAVYGRIVGARRGAVQPPVRTPPPAAPAEITEETVRQAMKGATLKTQQGRVSLPTIRKYVDMLKSGSKPPPIRVDEGIIVEGNHRYIAGRIYKQEPPIQPWAGGRPDRVVPWEKVEIDKAEW
ncbi:hypothetical protein [Mesorhizobium sp. CN2-181]|uniref:hypothetical protein n=1 Tax=Mesorhizobium yinganensis TaxID=3157707 RepID=UPI0032B7269D